MRHHRGITTKLQRFGTARHRQVVTEWNDDVAPVHGDCIAQLQRSDADMDDIGPRTCIWSFTRPCTHVRIDAAVVTASDVTRAWEWGSSTSRGGARHVPSSTVWAAGAVLASPQQQRRHTVSHRAWQTAVRALPRVRRERGDTFGRSGESQHSDGRGDQATRRQQMNISTAHRHCTCPWTSPQGWPAASPPTRRAAARGRRTSRPAGEGRGKNKAPRRP